VPFTGIELVAFTLPVASGHDDVVVLMDTVRRGGLGLAVVRRGPSLRLGSDVEVRPVTLGVGRAEDAEAVIPGVGCNPGTLRVLGGKVAVEATMTTTVAATAKTGIRNCRGHSARITHGDLTPRSRT
jgi:hypothetical protein